MENKKREMIFLSSYLAERTGGPATYLFNLYTGLKKLCLVQKDNSFLFEDLEITFLSRGILSKENQNLQIGQKKNPFKSLIKQILLSRFCPSKIAEVISFFNEKRIFYEIFKKKFDLLKEADFIYIHHVLDYYLLRNIISKKSTKILTIHSPESITQEIQKNDIKSKFLDKISKIEKEAMEWADVFIYPHKKSLETHLQVFPYLENILSNKKVIYYPTGVKQLNILHSRDEIRQRYNIPDNALIFSYVGRHIEVKGFDLLANAILKINKNLKDNRKIYLISAGTGELVEKFLKNKEFCRFWRHVDWTDTPGDIINASDWFILPNRRTFFDLVLLEAMSVGVPVLASYTGGNRYVGSLSSGIVLFNPEIENLIETIKKIQDIPMQKRVSMGRENYKIFNKYFTPESFAFNHIRAIKKLERSL